MYSAVFRISLVATFMLNAVDQSMISTPDQHASSLAVDHFLKLSPKKEERKPELLPAELRKHFTGVSIADLRRHNLIAISAGMLCLSDMYITDVTDLDTIPGIEEVTFINLSNNRITHLPRFKTALTRLQELSLHNNHIHTIDQDALDGMASLRWLRLQNNNMSALPAKLLLPTPRLWELTLFNNPVVRDMEQHQQIETELQTATNDSCNVSWSALDDDSYVLD